MPDPASQPVPNPPFPKNLTHEERRNLETFDELDFDVFTHADWARLGESHARNIRVHLRTVLERYVTHYNTRRPHRALHLTPPRPDHPIAHASPTRIRRHPILGGLINEYELAAA